MASKTAIVIVPGSFSYSSAYYEVVEHVKQRGHEVYVNNLPSASRDPPEEPATLEDDAVFFRAIIRTLADQGKNVVVVAHSYGGVVGTEAAKGMSKSDRASQGLSGGVVRMVYLTAFALPVGVSMNKESGERPSEIVETGADGFMRLVAVEAIAGSTFSDVPFDKAVEIVKRMPKHSAVSFAGELTYPAYKHIACSYILCENDSLVVPDVQRKMIEMIKQESGREVDVRTLSSGHAPNFSQPEKVAEIIVDIASSA